MTHYPKRLIEVDLPIKRISTHARREKSIRHGHISTLHIWWARRPLAACRAVICASLWPDPADELCPNMFRKVAREQMTKWAKNHMRLLSEESISRFVAISKDEKKLDDPVELRSALLDFIADFSNWDNSTVPEYLETSRILTQMAHKALGGESGSRPLVVDPFAGGGAIPLEALRVGADAFASDLNPVAVLLNKVVLEYIPKYGQRLADEVRKWGKWIKDQAEKELAEFYPKDPDGATPIAYLWARTILSEAPGKGDIPVEVPLLRSLWLAKKAGKNCALRWVRDDKERVITNKIEVKYANGKKLTVRQPLLEIFEPKGTYEVESGTVARGSTTCPVTGYTTPVSSVREQLKSRRGGAEDARLIVIRKNDQKTGRRVYRLVKDSDLRASLSAAEELDRQKIAANGELSLIPDEVLPIMSGVFNAPIYGHSDWGSLFSPRQALSLVTIARLVREAGKKISQENDTDFAVAIETCLAQALDRLADFNSSLCVLNAVGGRGVVHTFGRQALPMVWDFMETNPFNNIGANWMAGIDACIFTIKYEHKKDLCGQIVMASATKHPLPDDSAQVFLTDPPYYNAVPYADLSDFFYVWLKRTVGYRHPDLFQGILTPKDEECCEMASWDPNRYSYKDGKWFEGQMNKAMSEGRRILAPDGVGVVVFAHKSTAGWEVMLQSMVDAGWIITGSWPIDTERPGRLRAQGSAALASSIHLVCRPRENPDGSLRMDDVGDWRDVLAELPKRIHEWMPRLAEEGVVGADAIFACLGPALEIYSHYSSVEKASGEKVELKEYLEEVWAAISREALNMIFEGADASGFEEDARLTAMWLWTLRTALNGNLDDTDKLEPTKSLPGYSMEYDAARKIAQGLGAHLENLSHLVEIKGNIAMLLSTAARTRYLFGKDAAEAPKGQRKKKARQQTQFDFMHDIEQAEEESGGWVGKISGKAGSTILDQLHQSMILFAAGRSEALKRFLVEEGVGRNSLFWRLAQALSALYPAATDEKRWVDGVLARKKGLGL